MKPIVARVFFAALLTAAPEWVWAQQPGTDPAPKTTAASPQPATAPADPAAAPPVVRLPSFNPNPSLTASTASTGGGTSNGSASASSEFGLATGSTVSGPISSPLLRTNRTIESRGAIPKVLKPERRGVGGFLVGFANLFNPLAPVEQGTGGATEYWYDGQLNTAPLPRVFQDERYHEAGLGLITVPVDGDLSKDTKRKSKR